jgi:hypothetical protein
MSGSVSPRSPRPARPRLRHHPAAIPADLQVCHAGGKLQPKHTAHRGAVLRGQGGENRRKIDGWESPVRYHSDRAGATQEVANFRRAKACVDMDSKRTKPSAGKNRGQVTGPIWQPQRHPSARTHAPLRSPAARRSTRFWKAHRSSVPAASVTAGPAGCSSDHPISAPSVRGYSGP